MACGVVDTEWPVCELSPLSALQDGVCWGFAKNSRVVAPFPEVEEAFVQALDFVSYDAPVYREGLEPGVEGRAAAAAGNVNW